MNLTDYLPDWTITFGSDILTFLLYIGAFSVYYIRHDRRTRLDPTSTNQGVNNIARSAWVEDIMANRRDILAVQTLRNSTMAATFLASTAVLLIIGVLSLSEQKDKLSGAWHAVNAFGARHTELWILKLMWLLLDFFVAFFNFSLAIRTFNHVGYLLNVPRTHHETIRPVDVAGYLNQAGRYYSIGMRGYYVAIPVVFWLFGPIFMIVATGVLLYVLVRIDRAPQQAAPSRDAAA
jgi:uncharacterized membrane protein